MSPSADKENIVDRRLLWWVGPACVLPFFAALIYFVLLKESALAQMVYSLTKIFTLVWPLIVYFAVEHKKLALKRVDWAKHIRAIPLGLLTGGIIFAVTWILFEWSWAGEYVREATNAIRGKTEDLGVMDFYIPFAIFISLIHSLLEEYYWRWFVFGQLRRQVSEGWAVVLASLAFAAHHYVILSCYFSFWGTAIFGTLVGLGGALWCWQYHYQKSLVGSWISHLLVDAVILIIGYQLIFNGS